MASEDNKVPFLADPPPASEVPFNGDVGSIDTVAAIRSLSVALGDRRPVGDSLVGIIDTLQSLGSIPLAAAPGRSLADAVENSQTLDDFRSPAYLAERTLDALTSNPNASFLEGVAKGITDVVSGDNLLPDVLSQTPYLLLGPASRAAGAVRAEQSSSALARLSLGTNEAATINRIAALSGGVEGAGAYGQTYQRALEQTDSEDEASRQALQAAAVNSILGAGLGRLTPGFELDPTGRLAGKLASHGSVVAAEALVEEGGLAIGQVVFDNILAGKDPMDGVGEQFGQAVAISSVFTGGVRTPAATLDVAKEVGKGVRRGIDALASRAITPEVAAANAAESEVRSTEGSSSGRTSDFDSDNVGSNPAPSATTAEQQQEDRIRAELANQGLEGDALEQAVQYAQAAEAESSSPVPPEVQDLLNQEAADREARNSPENRQALEEAAQEEEAARQAKQETEDEAYRDQVRIDTNSSSESIKAILVDAANDALIENSDGEAQANAIARKEELSETVEKAKDLVSKLEDSRVANIVKAADEGNAEAARVVEAIKRTDITKLPDEAIPAEVKPVAKKLRDLKETKVNETSNQILVRGFNGSRKKRGIDGYMQDILNMGLLGVTKPNGDSTEFVRFMNHLRARAQAFHDALAVDEDSVEVAGTKTRTTAGGLQDKPFIIHKNNANSLAVVNAVFDDVKKAEEAFATAKKTFPGMFEGLEEAPVAGPSPTPAAPARPAPVAKTPIPKVEEEKTVLANEIPPARSESDTIEFTPDEVPAPKAEESSPAPVEEAPVVPELTLEETPEFNRAAELADIQVRGDEPIADRVGITESYQVTAPDSEGYITYTPAVNDSRQIISAFVPPGSRGRGYGKANLLELARQTEAAGETLTSDTSVSAAQLRVYESLKADGLLTFDYADPDAAATALKDGGKLMGQTPVIVNIRAVDVIPGTVPFADFNGVNHLVNGFKPTGGGMLAKSLNQLITEMEKGNEAEKQAAARLNRSAKPLRDAINRYVTKSLNAKLTKSGEQTVADALKAGKPLHQYADRIWVNALIPAGDGYQLHPAVADALAVAGIMQMTRSAFDKQVTVVDENTQGRYYSWVNNIGKDAMRILGTNPDFNQSVTITDGIPKSLALTVLEALRTAGAIDITSSVTEDSKTIYNLNMDAGIAETLREFPAFAEVMRKFLGDAEDDTIHIGAPPTKVKRTYRNSRTPISNEQATALTNRQKVVHYRNTPFMTLVQALGTRYARLTTGFAKTSTDPMMKEVSEGLVSGIRMQLAGMNQYNASIEQHATENGIAAEDVPVHFSYEILRNGRSFSGLSPQTQTTLREWLTVGRETLDLSDVNTANKLKLAIAQAVGIKTDIYTHEEVLQQLEAKIPELAPLAKAVHEASLSGDVSSIPWEGTKIYSPKEIHGLMILGKYLANPTASDFVNTLTFEIDGKTNGPFMAELLFGLHDFGEKLMLNLKQGGFFWKVADATLATMRDAITENGARDLYARIANKSIGLTHPLLIATGLATKEGGATRDLAKAAVTPLVYGSGLGVNEDGEITGGLAGSFVNLLQKEHTVQLNDAIRSGDKKTEAYLRKLTFKDIQDAAVEAAVSLYANYQDEKPGVTRSNELMGAAMSFHANVRAELFNQRAAQLLTEKRKSGDLPPQFDLSRNDFDALLRALPGSEINVPGMGTIAVAEGDNRGTGSQGVKSAGNTLEVPVSVAQITDPRISILALLTIGAGDAAMGNRLFQTERQVLDVYDGIEMSVSQIDDIGETLNKAVWDTSTPELMDQFAQLLEFVKTNSKYAYGDFSKRAYKNLKRAYGVSGIKPLLNALQADLKNMSERNKVGRARLESEPSSMNQMAGGRPFNTAKGITRTAPAVREIRFKWNPSIEAGFDANGGKLDRSGIRSLLDGVKFKSPVHRMVWNKLRDILPDGINLTLAKNEDEWNAQNTGYTYGHTRGVINAGTSTIVLSTTNVDVILHELIHSLVSNHISQYFSNINEVPVELRAPINDLVQLLNRFKQLKTTDATTLEVQAFVRMHEAKGDIAAAVDEMIAHVLSESEVIEALQPTLLERVVNRLKQIINSIFGTNLDEGFLLETLDVFNQLTINPTEVASGPVRTSPLFDKTDAAFRALAAKIARGQHFTVPKASENHLSKLQDTYNLSPEQQRLYARVYTLLRMDNRTPVIEQYASTVLGKHPNGKLFVGAKDSTAAVMALTAVDPTFSAQADEIWQKSAPGLKTADGLINAALEGAVVTTSEQLLTRALDAMAEDAEYNLSWLGTQTQRLDRRGNEILEKVGAVALEASEKAPPGIAEVLQGINALTTETGAAAFGKVLFKAVNEFTDQRWLQDLTSAVVGSQQDTDDVFRQVNTMKSNIAQTRSLFTINLPAQLKKLFPEGFDGWNHLFKDFGRIDAGVLGSAAGQMFTDHAERKKTIEALKSKLPNHWDAENLAHYMLHGTVTPGSPHPLLRNARAIADNLNGRKRKASDNLIADVDQLVTLMAIDMMNTNDRTRIAGYFEQHPQAMANLTGMLQKVSEEDGKRARTEYRYTYWKGALPLSTDPRTSVVVAGSVRGASLEALGYTRGKPYKAGRNDPGENLFYYTRNYAPPPVFTQGVLATVQQTAMGINYSTSSTISPEVGTFITSPRLVNYISRNMGRNNTLVPVFNFEGDVIAYERLLDREYVQQQTKSNNTLLHIAIGHKLGRVMEERMASRFNREAVEILVNQWNEGVKNGEEAQYVDVSSSTDKQVQRAWEVIPGETKQALRDGFGGRVMIRKDLLANTLGYHKAGVHDIFTGDASLSEQTRKAMYGLAQILMGPSAAKYIYRAELAIKEGVATAKDWIIVRSLSVALNNAMASMNLVLANGVPFRELAKSYQEGLRDLRAYTRLQKEIINLTVKIAGTTGSEQKRLKAIQLGKYEAIKKLAIYPLIEAGELSDLPEGLEETPSHSYLGDLAGWLNNHLRKIHPKTPTVLANIAIAKDTAFHDALSKSIQAGDFLGKWAVYKHMVKSGKSPEVARNVVRDEFVSYSTNPGRFRGALEDYGLVWWSQFTLRAQKVLLRRFRRNPFSFFAAQGFSNVAGNDGPLDQAIWERGWDNSTGMDGIVNAPSAHIWAKVF